LFCERIEDINILAVISWYVY